MDIPDSWFHYHPPTDVTKPKHEAIGSAVKEMARRLHNSMAVPVSSKTRDFPALHEQVNLACKGLVEVINRACPDSADKTTSVRCVRLARMHANRFLCAVRDGGAYPDGIQAEDSRQRALSLLTDAAMWANASIACHDWGADDAVSER